MMTFEQRHALDGCKKAQVTGMKKLYKLITITRLLPHCPIKLRQCESDYYYNFAHPQHTSGILI